MFSHMSQHSEQSELDAWELVDMAQSCQWHLTGPHVASSSANYDQGTKAIIIVLNLNNVEPAHRILEHLENTGEDLPPVLVLLTRVSELEDFARVLEVQKELLAMGIEDVICNSRTRQQVKLAIAMSLVRVWDKSQVVRDFTDDLKAKHEAEMRSKNEALEAMANAPEPKTGFFWQVAHSTFDGFPMLDGRLIEAPAPGVQIGPCEVESQLGRGRFGMVYTVKNTVTGEQEALKAMPKDRMDGVEMVAAVWREISCLAKLQHPSVVRFAGALQGVHHIFVRMEHCGRCNLFRALRAAGGPLSYEAAQDYFSQLAAGVEHCNSRNIAHRDLKPENIAISEDAQHIKIVDFGSATSLNKVRSELVGTMPFMPPEIMATTRDRPYRPADADVWASAVVLLEMLCGIGVLSTLLGWERGIQPCPARCSELRAFFRRHPQALSEKIEQHVGSLDGDLQELLAGMLTISTDDRWSAAQVDGSSWVLACRAREVNVDDLDR